MSGFTHGKTNVMTTDRGAKREMKTLQVGVKGENMEIEEVSVSQRWTSRVGLTDAILAQGP